MLEILAIVTPIFLVVGTGYTAARTGMLRDDAVDVLLHFVMHFAVTALLFTATATLDWGGETKLPLLASFYGPAVMTFVVGMLFARLLFKMRPGHSVAAGFVGLFGNTVFIGIPVIERAYGEAAMAPIFAIIAFHAPSLYAMGIISMESSARDGAGAVGALTKAARTLARNPLVLSVAAGFLWNFTGFAIPLVVSEALDVLAAAALPIGMFCVGAALNRYSIAGELKAASVAVLLKLLVFPVATYILAFHVFTMDPVWAKTAVMMAALPGGLNIYLFAALYKRQESLAANALLIGTALSVFTLTGWLAFLG